MNELITFSDYFLVVNDVCQYYYISEDGWFDGFYSGLEHATIFNNDLFESSILLKKFKESDVKKVYFTLKVGD